MYSAIDSNKRRSAVLIVFFIALVAAIGWAFRIYYGTGPELVVFALLFAGAMTLFSYYRGDRVALWSAGARLIEKKDAPELYRLVENLCITSGLPMPKVHIIEDSAPNAFATGRDPQHASIAFTTGLVQRLEKAELEGVVAHELSHIKNYDIRLMMLVVVLVGTVALLADMFLRMNLYGGGRRRERSGGGGANILLIIGVALIVLSPFIAELIKLAVSRRREYLADASGALLTRYPDGLARALEKIAAHHAPLQRASDATAHLYIANPFAAKKRWFGNLFSTHPPVEDRIAKLRGMLSRG